MKGYPDGIQNVVMHVDTRAPGIQISPYPGPGRRGNYTADRVWIEDVSGKVLDERAASTSDCTRSSRPTLGTSSTAWRSSATPCGNI
jgi:hypothetical protein